MKIPEEIEHGRNDELVLDCDFEIQDTADANGLEIKYYWNVSDLVYQWVPYRSAPQALGILKDRLDLSYKVTDDAQTMFRAMKIKRISPELSGLYTCKISSFLSEDTQSKKMIIYGEHFSYI